MSMTDPIADMLTRIRNAINRRHASVDIPHSKMKESIARILQDEGFIQRYEIVPDGRFQALRVHLKYAEGRRPVLTHLKRLSTPGRRLYAGSPRSRVRSVAWASSSFPRRAASSRARGPAARRWAASSSAKYGKL